MILYTPGLFFPLYKINASGGVPVQVTNFDNSLSEERHFNAQFLPDNRHFIYSGFSRNAGESAIYVGSLDKKPRIRIMSINLNAGNVFEKARFVSPDYIFFQKNNSLMEQKFDISDFKVQNEPQLVLNNVSDFSISNNVLIVSRNLSNLKSDLILYNRLGKKLKTIDNLGIIVSMSLSPDGNNLAYHRVYGPDKKGNYNQDIWIYDRTRDISTRFTTAPASDATPVWSPDGKLIAYASSPDSIFNIYEKSIESSSKPVLLLKTNAGIAPKDWSSNGKYILYHNDNGNLWALPMFANHKPFPYLHNGFNNPDASFSPDCKWVAYSSNESGKYQIYIQSFPVPKGKIQVSTNGGRDPQWQKDGKELFYISSDNKLMAVKIKTEPQIHIGSIVPLFDVQFDGWSNMYKVLNNGQEFLVNQFSFHSVSKPLKVVLNWRNLLNEK